jgi:hypothetical protein
METLFLKDESSLPFPVELLRAKQLGMYLPPSLSSTQHHHKVDKRKHMYLSASLILVVHKVDMENEHVLYAPAPTLTFTLHWGLEGQSRKTCRCLLRIGDVTIREQSPQEKVPLLYKGTWER